MDSIYRMVVDIETFGWLCGLLGFFIGITLMALLNYLEKD